MLVLSSIDNIPDELKKKEFHIALRDVLGGDHVSRTLCNVDQMMGVNGKGSNVCFVGNNVPRHGMLHNSGLVFLVVFVAHSVTLFTLLVMNYTNEFIVLLLTLNVAFCE